MQRERDAGFPSRLRAMVPILAMPLVLVAFSGCTPTKDTGSAGSNPPAETNQPCDVARDNDATLVTIKADFSVDNGHPHLSQSKGDKIQWKNTSSDQLLIIFKGTPGGILVDAGKFSPSVSVCRDPACVSTTPYEYRFWHLNTATSTWEEAKPPGGPTQPEVVVDG